MSNIKLFESKQIRTVWNELDEKWYFVVADVIQVLTGTPNPSDYIKKMRKRDEELSKGWRQFVTPLSVDTIGGKQKMNCASAKRLLCIIQSIPSLKAEPFKHWLAEVGSDRLDKIENPELATLRTR
jgi:prophage antirepressor-like protein